jgi:hypothetical protein
VEVNVSRFASRRFRQFLALCLFACVVGGGTALGLVAGRSSGAVWIPLMVFFSGSVLMLSICVDSLDRGPDDDEDDEDEDDFRRGWDDPPLPPDGPGGLPVWWPQFEADFRAYVSETQTAKARVSASMLDRKAMKLAFDRAPRR